MKTTIYITWLLLTAAVGFAQKELIIADVAESQLPADIKWGGKFKRAWRWQDKLGENLVVISETGIYGSHEGHRNAEIFAYHFLLGETSKPIWKLYDFEKDCPVDVEAEFMDDAITDLDNDGINEIWLVYKKACRGDVSPSEMKIIMYEGGKKYAMRGENKVQVSEKETYGGNYTFDEAFSKAKIFQKFALKKWQENILQKW
ncbi:VCBS repeat-containing protein [Flavobacterium longum]|uniref:M949_RS01915 family surface polysaccharide biosynthesis protein n=1 Tax=Flavobacterium longum TaxID=1299340 RepID=UPI0039E88233